MKKLFRHTHRAAFHLGLAFLILLALGLSALRFWLLPRIADFRQPLEAQLGALVGETLSIEALSARLHGFRPELSLTGLNILDPQGRSAIRFATVRLDLDPFRTLASGEPRFDSVEIVGPKLSIRRKQDGSIAVVGLTLVEAPPAWLLADGRIALLDAQVEWLDGGSPPLKLGRVDLRLDNRRDRHRLAADFGLPEALGRSLRLALDAEGDLFGPGWRGVVYLEGGGIDAARLENLPPAGAFGLRSGLADARVWLRWEGAVRSVAGEFSLIAPILAHRSDAHGEQQLALKSLGGRFSWRSNPGGWRLDLSHLRPALREAWPETRMAVEIESSGDGAWSSAKAAASYLDIGDLRTILRSLPVLDESTAVALESLAPRGVLENAGIFYAPSAAPGEKLGVYGRFRGVAANPWRSIPGISELGGEFRGTDASGRADLSSKAGSLALPRLKLKHPVRLVDLRTRLFWWQTAEDWELSVPSLAAHNSDFKLAAELRATISKTAEISPFVDLRARLSRVDVAALPGYLPCALIEDTCRWMDKALEGGRVPRADILFHGFAADFPFYRNEGIFQAEVDTENLKIRYNPDWPPLEETDAHFSYRGPGVEAESRAGRIGAGRIAEIHAAIPDLIRNPRLALSGTVHAGVAESLDFLSHSPLREIPERLRRIAEVSGTTDISLNLSVPLGSAPGSPGVAGTADLHRAGLRLDDTGLEIGEIEGLLNFDGNGIRAENLQARILERPATLAVDHENSEISVDILGNADIAGLERQFPAAFWHYARGAADYRLNLRFPETLDARSAPLTLALDSDLKGLALDLPAPFGKPEQAEKNLSLETSVRAGENIPVRLAYGSDIKAQARLSDSGPRRGYRLENADLAIGQALPPPGAAPGFALYAHMEEADLGEWRRWWTGHAPAGTQPGTMRELSLHLGKLSWNGQNLGPASLGLKRGENLWKGRIYSLYAKGEVTAAPGYLHLDLESLKLPKPSSEPAAQPSAADSPEIDPEDIPSLRVRARRLFWRNADLGSLELDTERRAHGMIVKNLTVKTHNHALELRGNWTHTPAREASTHVEGKLRIESLGELLALLGLPEKVRDTPSDVNLTLDWPGSPRRFSAAGVAGEIKLNLGKGSLLKIEPGLGRMIGMLNLNSLWRRLSLDFSDLFGQGLAYDGIAGTFRLGEGLAVTDGFLIDAVSARILVSGRAGLAARDMDQVVTVIPHTSAALPIAGALAGGPAVGAAVYVAQRLIGEEVDSIAATHYAVQGSWEHPSITRINHYYMPLDVLDRAWSGVKDLSGFGSKQEER